MQSTALQFSLPTFDELRMTAARPRHIGEGKTRIMNVIAAVPALNVNVNENLSQVLTNI